MTNTTTTTPALDLSIYSYRTGELLRDATEAEAAHYLAEIGDCYVGAVDGARYGYGETVFMR